MSYLPEIIVGLLLCLLVINLVGLFAKRRKIVFGVFGPLLAIPAAVLAYFAFTNMQSTGLGVGFCAAVVIGACNTFRHLTVKSA